MNRSVTKIKTESGVKSTNWKAGIWVNAVADDIIFYAGKQKDSTKRLLELWEFGKVIEYKINTQKINCPCKP